MVEGPHRLHVRPADSTGFQSRHDGRGGRPADDSGGGAGGGAASRHHAAPPERGGHDLACPFGIPAEDMTPNVRAALEGLLAQFDEVRKQHQAERGREADLQGLADGHPVLPVGNRRYLIRELSRVIARSRVAQTLNTFLMISIANGAEIRRCHGEAAAHALLCDVAARLVSGVRASDVVGSLGGYDFGIILTLAGGGAAEEKAKSLVAALSQSELDWNGTRLRPDTDWGYSELGPDDAADEVIAAADRALVARAMRAPG